MYQSGKFFSTHSVMVKRGSKYLRFSLMNLKIEKMLRASIIWLLWDMLLKKLVRVIYYLLKTNNVYQADKVA